MSKEGFAIAIDGPVAAGKGTIAPRLAEKLKGFYLYTGAMYRCLALSGLKNGINLEDKNSLISLLPQINIEFRQDRVFLNGVDVTDEIKDPKVASGSSKVAIIPKVREHMVKKQQEIALKAITDGKIVVAEGRDTGTIVFPNAKLKVFLTANPNVRAERRLNQLKEQGLDASFDKVLSEIKERDIRDLQREVDPLVSDPSSFGYFVLDNSNLSEEETLIRIIEKLE